jgi:hypothetical protein
VPAAADGDLETRFMREKYRMPYIGFVSAPGDQCRTLVHQAIVDAPRLLVAIISRFERLNSSKIGLLSRSLAGCVTDILMTRSYGYHTRRFIEVSSFRLAAL